MSVIVVVRIGKSQYSDSQSSTWLVGEETDGGRNHSTRYEGCSPIGEYRLLKISGMIDNNETGRFGRYMFIDESEVD